MKRLQYLTLLVATVLGFATITLTGCGSRRAVERTIEQALISGDTTQATFDSIASLIKASPDRYADLLDDKGELNYGALNDLVQSIGNGLRPPKRWNVLQYGMKELSLTIYFERSGSMVPYDTPGGRGELKKAVNNLINFFPGSEVTVRIVNDDIYPYQGDKMQFLQDRNIYASTANVGNAKYTDFQKIFEKVIKAQNGNNVSVVVTDLIYSPADTKDVSVDKILNEENSLATSIFKQYKGKSVIVHRLMGDYNGFYYPYNNQPVEYHGERPFFLLIIADTSVIDAMQASGEYDAFLNPSQATHSYRFNQEQGQVDYNIVPGWKDNAGRFRIDKKDKHLLTHCDGDKKTGELCFTVAANLAPMHKPADFLSNPANYTLQSQSGFTMTVTPITHDLIDPNSKEYIEGNTHLLTFKGQLKSPRDEVTIELRNDFPEWVSQCSANSDTDTGSANFASTTLGLEQWLQGMQAAFGQQGIYTTMTIKLQR